jgi:hypothetical protein
MQGIAQACQVLADQLLVLRLINNNNNNSKENGVEQLI